MRKIKINKKLIEYNFSKRSSAEIKYIVIHDTGNTDIGADAENHYKFLNSGNQGRSAHYFVDDKQILQVVEDENRGWSVGDGNGSYGITNDNSINIEMCVNSDGNFEETYRSTLWLVRHLMRLYRLTIDNVVRHYDASRKTCPHIMRKNNWELWHKFKNDLRKIPNKDNDYDYMKTITLLYNNLFQRQPDEEGLNYWNDRLNLDLTIPEMLKLWGETEEFKEKYLIKK